MQTTEYKTNINTEEGIDISLYMGACNNGRVMFWMVPEEEETHLVD